MTRGCWIAVLAALTGCQPVLEDPGEPRVILHRPAPEQELTHVTALTVEAELEACNQVARVRAFVNGSEMATAVRGTTTDEDLEWVDDCPAGRGCVNVPIDRLLAAGAWGTIGLRVEAECEGADFAGASDEVAVSVEPFTMSTPLVSAGLDLIADRNKSVISVGYNTVTFVSFTETFGTTTMPVVPGGRMFVTNGRLYHVVPCTGRACDYGWFTVRSSGLPSTPGGAVVGVPCLPADMGPGPGDNLLTIVGNCPDLHVTVAAADLSSAVTNVVPSHMGLLPLRQSVVHSQGGGIPLSRLRVRADATVDPVVLDVELRDIGRTTLADDASWSAVAGRERVRLLDREGILIASLELGAVPLSGGPIALSAIPGTDRLLVVDERTPYEMTPDRTFVGLEAGHPLVDARLIGDSHVALVDDRGVIEIRGLEGHETLGTLGPFPATWELSHSVTGRNGWFHAVFVTPEGVFLLTLDPEQLSP